METLGKLFGSNDIVKILRLFLFNPNQAFETKEVASKARVRPEIVRAETSMMEKIGLIKCKSFFKEVTQKKKNGKKAPAKKRTRGWMLNENFVYLAPLQTFFAETTFLNHDSLVRRIKKAGRLKLVIVAGIFLKNFDARVDLLIVGDALKKRALETAIKDLEAEMGKEIRYAIFSTNDFKYRLNMRDRLMRDILDFPHHKLVNRLNII